MGRTIIAGALFLISTFATAFAADKEPFIQKYGEWTATGPWGGGYVQNVVPCPRDPNRVYAYIDIGGVSRSDDKGNTWRSLNRTLQVSCYQVRSLSVDPRDADCFVIAAGTWPSKWEERAGIYRTEDAGKTFQRVAAIEGFSGNDSFRPDGFLLDRNPNTPDEIIAASIMDGVWKSGDNGRSWKCLGLKGVYPSDIRFDRSNPKRLWLCSPAWVVNKPKPAAYETGFLRSDDGGASWTKLSSDSPYEILQDPSDPKRLFGIFDNRIIKLSLDGGCSWQDFNKGLPYGERTNQDDWLWCSHKFNALAAGPDFILTANANGDFFRLDKGQDTWKPVVRKKMERNGWWAPLDESKWPYFGKALGSITIDPKDPKHWYFTDWYSVWQTEDSGESWRPTTEGMAQTVGFTIVPDPFNANVLHLGMADNGYFRSDDNGTTWKLNKIDSSITCLSPSPSTPGVVYACGGHKTNLYRSEDSGISWKRPACKGLPKMERDLTGVYSLAVDANDPKKVYACVGSKKPGLGGVYESGDSGETWTRKSNGLPDMVKNAKGETRPTFPSMIWDEAGRRELASAKDGSLIAISKTAGATYRWEAESASWKKLDLASCPLDIAADPFHAGRYILAATDCVVALEDGGKSWRKLVDIPSLKGIVAPENKWFMAGRVAIDHQEKGRIAIAVNNGMLLSSDDGKTWGYLDQSIPDRYHKDVPAFQNGRLFVETVSNGVFWLDLAKATITKLPPTENQ